MMSRPSDDRHAPFGVCVLTAIAAAAASLSSSAAELVSIQEGKQVPLSIAAGSVDRIDVPVCVLVDAPIEQSAWIQFPDGSLGRSQLLEPGLLHESARGTGKKELYFSLTKLSRAETLGVVAALSAQPMEGRGYVWTGDTAANRRLSCTPCHQGTGLPTAKQLREEWTLLQTTGQVPPLVLRRLLPTAKGRDFRWHETEGKYERSTCWECHDRHMVQYEFGQSLTAARSPQSPNESQGAQLPAALQSVYHKVFRMAGDRPFLHSEQTTGSSGRLPCGIHYGFEQAILVSGSDRVSLTTERCLGIVQRHAGTLSEETGKFLGRHTVAVDWIGACDTGKVIAREERELTVKNQGGRNGGRSLWIDVVSKLTASNGALQLDAAVPAAGLRLVVPVDAGVEPDYQEAADWKAITFSFDCRQYTAVCFNHPRNPPPADDSRAQRGVLNPLHEGERLPGIQYAFSAEADPTKPQVVHYRLWIQDGRMAPEDIDAMSKDFVEPVAITVH